MALKIVKATDVLTVKNLVMCIYSQPGLGKSTLGFSADAPVLLDFDRGAYRAANRGDSVQIDGWEDVARITEADLTPYKTVVIDTVGRALDFLSADIVRRNAKLGRGGALTLQGYGALKAEFAAWLKTLRLMGKDVILVAHSSEEKNGDDIFERLDVQGGSKGEIYKCADAMGRLSMVDGLRVLNFDPSDTAFGKNPGQLLPQDVPDIATVPNYLALVVQAIKDKLNTLSDEQKERQAMIADWLDRFDAAKTAEDYTSLVGEVKGADQRILPVVKGELHRRATAAGYTFAKGAYQ